MAFFSVTLCKCKVGLKAHMHPKICGKNVVESGGSFSCLGFLGQCENTLNNPSCANKARASVTTVTTFL
jgi:hypothetical protein